MPLTLAVARVHWSCDDWRGVTDSGTQPSGLGTHYVDLPTASLTAGSRIGFAATSSFIVSNPGFPEQDRLRRAAA